MMSSVALRYCKSEEDSIQMINMAFLKVLQNIERYDASYALATWIRTILVRHIIDEYRKSNRQLKNVRIEDASFETYPLETNLAEYHFTEMQLRYMLNQLPDVTRTVFNLFAMEGYKHAEIASVLGISDGTSKWHVNEARKRLKLMMKQFSEEEREIKRASI